MGSAETKSVSVLIDKISDKASSKIEDSGSVMGYGTSKRQYGGFFYFKKNAFDNGAEKVGPSRTTRTGTGKNKLSIEENRKVLGSTKISTLHSLNSTTNQTRSSQRWLGTKRGDLERETSLTFKASSSLTPCDRDLVREIEEEEPRKVLMSWDTNCLRFHEPRRLNSDSILLRSVRRKWKSLKKNKERTESFPVLARGVDANTNADPISHKAMTLNYLVVQTSYGFSTLKTRPMTDCGEAIFHQNNNRGKLVRHT
ncbi:hypothetical protein SNE40_011507 [Patella caerulea]|uniref:Uncharacterized protein n=1 Tax=Patella caerulea TaxID=87958 RepID=A0AAN8JMU4_PATCE